jgi:hypothetical protein
VRLLLVLLLPTVKWQGIQQQQQMVWKAAMLRLMGPLMQRMVQQQQQQQTHRARSPMTCLNSSASAA